MPSPTRMRKMLGPYPKCSIDWCMRQSEALKGGLCGSHKSRKTRGYPMDAPMREWRHDGLCAFDGCERVKRSREWCNYHYQQWKKGQPMIPKPKFGTLGSPAKWGVCVLPPCGFRAREGFDLCQPHRTVAKKYGMTFDELIEFWGDGTCRACGEHGARMSVDHDHDCCKGGNEGACGKCNRGLLCHLCNAALGMMRDSAERLVALACYVESYATRV